MAFEDVKKAAEGLKDKAAGLADSTFKDETKTDGVLDAVANAARKVTGGRFDDKIDTAREAADGKIGSE